MSKRTPGDSLRFYQDFHSQKALNSNFLVSPKFCPPSQRLSLSLLEIDRFLEGNWSYLHVLIFSPGSWCPKTWLSSDWPDWTLIFTYILIHVRVCVFTHICTYVYTRAHTHVYIHMYTYVYTYIYIISSLSSCSRWEGLSTELIPHIVRDGIVHLGGSALWETVGIVLEP